MNYSVGECVKVPTFVPEDLRERLEQYVLGQFIWMPWSKLYRRDFLLENRIEFPQMKFAEDVTFCFKCLCLAKKYLHVPHVTNIRRERSDSAARIIRTSQELSKLWMNIFVNNMVMLDEFTRELEFFRTNPVIRYDVMKHYVAVHFTMIRNLFKNKQSPEVQENFFEALENPALNQHGKNLVAAYLFSERALNK